MDACVFGAGAWGARRLVVTWQRVCSRPRERSGIVEHRNVADRLPNTLPRLQGYDSGERDGRLCGRPFRSRPRPKQVVIGKDQIHSLLVDFDQADFFNLEDRAFAWGFHTSRVGVRIAIDGKTKEVWSDTYHIGSKSGLQARFVEATVAIDKDVGTGQWVKCDEGRCGK